jgi:hypothetical protein
MDQDMPEVSSDCSRPVLHSPVSAPCLPFPGGYTANGFVRQKTDLETRVAPSPRAGTGEKQHRFGGWDKSQSGSNARIRSRPQDHVATLDSSNEGIFVHERDLVQSGGCDS